MDSLKSIPLLERTEGIPSKAYSRTSSCPPVLTASPPQALERITKGKFRLKGFAPATLTLGQGGEVEVEKEEDEKQVLRLHQGTKISSLAVLQSSDKDCCLVSSGAEDGLVKFWTVTDKGWSLVGQFQCKGPAVTKVVGCVGGQEALEVEGKEKISRTIGRLMLMLPGRSSVKVWPP